MGAGRSLNGRRHAPRGHSAGTRPASRVSPLRAASPPRRHARHGAPRTFPRCAGQTAKGRARTPGDAQDRKKRRLSCLRPSVPFVVFGGRPHPQSPRGPAARGQPGACGITATTPRAPRAATILAGSSDITAKGAQGRQGAKTWVQGGPCAWRAQGPGSGPGRAGRSAGPARAGWPCGPRPARASSRSCRGGFLGFRFLVSSSAGPFVVLEPAGPGRPPARGARVQVRGARSGRRGRTRPPAAPLSSWPPLAGACATVRPPFPGGVAITPGPAEGPPVDVARRIFPC